MGTTRAAVQSGSFQKVTLGATSKVLGAGTWAISGGTRKTIDVSEFGDDIDQFEFGTADGGTISITGVCLDPTDPEQNTLRSCMVNKVKLVNSTTSGPRFWINSTSYYTIGTSGAILMTNAISIQADRNNVAKTSFEGKVSGAFMYLI
ncbi:MAG: hypothetical protein PHF12_05745 [Candidatus Omnitrophica bacterium]|jgi:hypothetical protein|nr:hypothetical protein [Candidatus Omnitrophota bacterium]